MLVKNLLAAAALGLTSFAAAKQGIDRSCGLKIAPCPEDTECIPNSPDCTDLNRCTGRCYFKNQYQTCGGFTPKPPPPCKKGTSCIDDSRIPNSCGMACDMTGICAPKKLHQCRGIAGLECPKGLWCYDDPSDDCDPENGGPFNAQSPSGLLPLQMNSHTLKTSIYQPLDNPSQRIRLLQIQRPPKLSPELINQITVVGYLGALLSPPRHTQTPIKCKLLTFKLDETPTYKALSYTWGSLGHVGTIQVDGQDVPVGRNLFTALQRLYHDSSVEYLWADALCINQSDDEEKSHQVPLMSQIYSLADTVFVWLGEALDSTEEAFSFMRTSLSYGLELIDVIGMESDDWDSTSSSAHFPRLEAFMREKMESLNTDSNKRAMEQLFENPYWTRIWVLQEFSHASSCHLICGHHTIDMANMNLFLFFWETASRLQLSFAGSPDWDDDIFGPLREFLQVRTGTSTGQAYRAEFQKQSGWHEFLGDRSQQTSPAHSDIFTLFVKTVRYKATDIRDKVYALLNLIPSEHRIVEPNYRLSEASLYRDLITSGITHYDSLYCITMGGIGTFEDSTYPNLPSWIPDFRRMGNSQFPYAPPIFMVGFGNHNNLDASGSRGPLYSFSDQQLKAKGFLVDKIGKVTQIPSVDKSIILSSILLSLGTDDWKQNGQTGIYKELFKAIFPPQLLIEPYDPFSEGSDPSWAAEKTLASGFMISLGVASLTHYFSDKFENQYMSREREGQNPTMVEALQFVAVEGNPALSYLFSACYEDLITGVSQSDDPVAHQAIGDQLYQQATIAFGTGKTEENGDTGEAYLIPFHELSDSDSAAKFASIFLDRLQSLWASRAFAVTERGYMGFVRPGTRVGDEVCILYGCPSPLVIRPDEGEYLLVGDCCFEGMMRGEMVKKQEEGEFVLQDLTFK
ncbi:hypothetical protein N0V84_012595 [Fusarium piperis]|uniref:Heterokaryon incompatibility domain-containing protein n=1 Tax=Fusarium piperis TaxID=1435070 RepID=A0A9W8W3G5_9HYPO|nr:hypothetical protein N0V84_012595 [Fusarium piperis]